MSYLYSHKEIMLLRLKMKRNPFTSHFIIFFKRSYRSFDVILKTHFKRIEFIIRLFLQKRLFSLYQRKIINYVFISIIAI